MVKTFIVYATLLGTDLKIKSLNANENTSYNSVLICIDLGWAVSKKRINITDQGELMSNIDIDECFPILYLHENAFK